MNFKRRTYNITEIAGAYYIIVVDAGYNTFYDNITLATGHTDFVNAILNKSSQSPLPPSSNKELYMILGGVAVAAIAG